MAFLKQCILLLFLLPFSVAAQENNYTVELDINSLEDDRLKVKVYLPRMSRDTIDYLMPVMVPGVYARAHYGKYIQNFKAVAKDGTALKVKRINKEKFRIFGGNKLDYLVYEVDDSWEKINFIFRPAGTNFEEGKNFMLNHPVYVGYVEGFKHLPYVLDVLHPEAFYGASALNALKRSPIKDRFRAEGYTELADNPIMYCVPDTASHLVGNTRVRVSVYSENGHVKASQINAYIRPLTIATEEFLGKLPVAEYNYIFYFTAANGMMDNLHKGALEHHRGSVYYLTETVNERWLKQSIRSIAAHEFLHILTPLHLHSEHISDFNFHDPKMSRHLWLYEGVTEYLSMLLEVKTDLITEDEFINRMNHKIGNASEFKPYSFTEMSQHIIDGKTVLKKMKKGKLYGDVYEKGALVAFMLDIRLNELSNGKRDLLTVIQKMILRYGKDRPFDDAGFIEDFVSITYPEMRDFFSRYVEGKEALPFKEYLTKLGWDYVPAKTKHESYVKKVMYRWDGTSYSVHSVGKNTPGFFVKDKLLTINGEEVNTVADLNKILYAKKDEEIAIEVSRGGIKMLLKTNKTLTIKPKIGRIYSVARDPNEGLPVVWSYVFQ